MRKKAVAKYFGGVSTFTRAIGVSRKLYYKWGDTVPEPYASRVQVITDGELRASPLRWDKDTGQLVRRAS